MSHRAVAVLAVVTAIASTSMPEGQTSTGSSQTELRSLAGEWQEVFR